MTFEGSGEIHYVTEQESITVAANNQTISNADGTISDLKFAGAPGPAVNSSGDVAFYGQVRNGSNRDGAILRASGGEVTLIAKTGDPLPFGNGTFGPITNTAAINEAGQLAFFTQSVENSFVTDGIYRESAGSIVPIAQVGMPAPDGNGVLTDANTAGSFGNRRPALNARGEVAFFATLTSTTGGGEDDSAIYRGNGEGLTQIARRGDPVPGGDGLFNRFVTIAHNSMGEVAFQAILRDTNSPDTTNGIYLANGIDTIQIARSGQVLAEGEISVRYGPGIEGLLDPQDIRLNDHGEFTFLATLAGRLRIFRFTPPNAHWAHDVSGDWDLAGNWRDGVSPNSLYDTFIEPVATPIVVSATAESTIVRTLSLGGGSGPLATLQIAGQSSTEFRSIGPVTISPFGRLVLRDGRGLTAQSVENSGRILVQNGDSIVRGAVDNLGVVTVDSGASVTFVDDVSNRGAILVAEDSTLVFAESFSGNGVAGLGHVTFRGDVRPDEISGGMSIAGSATFDQSAALSVRFGMSGGEPTHGRLIVDGQATLDGSIFVDVPEGITPPVNATFSVVEYGSHVGEFGDLVIDPSLPHGLNWTLTYTPTGVNLSTSAMTGDVNLDGVVDRGDVGVLVSHLGTSTGANWTMGDIDGDGRTSIRDLILLRNNLSAEAVATTEAAAVPEPRSELILLPLAVLAMLACWRKAVTRPRRMPS